MEPLFTQDEVAEILRVSHRTLEVWRTLGKGPVFVRSEGSVLYTRSDLEAYIDERRVAPVSA